MSSPLITIIIPVYNVEKYLRRCVDSAINQTYTNLKIVLVDDGSSDNCPAICDKYAEQDKRISVIHKQNGGLSSARNAALDCHHGGLFIFFLDSDDFLHPQAIETLYNILIDQQADMVQCQFIHGHADVFPKVKIHHKCKVYNNTNIFYSKRMSLCVWAGLYKQNLWDGVRMPLGTVNEDDATSWQVYYKSKKIAITKLPLYYYYININSTMWRQKKNLRLDFIDHYHCRINFFREKGMKLHTELSQWRFCLPLMMSYVSSKVATKDQRDILYKEFYENIDDVLKCTKVPFTHKCLFFLFRYLPNICRFFALKLGIRGKY